MNGMKKLAGLLFGAISLALVAHGVWVLLDNDPLLLLAAPGQEKSTMLAWTLDAHKVVAWVVVGLGALGFLAGVRLLGKGMYKKKGGKKSSRGSRRR